MQREDKNRVEHDVGCRAECHGEHAGSGKALTVDVRIETERQHDAQRTDQVNHDVRGRIRVRHLTGAEQVEQRAMKRDAKHSQHGTAQQQHKAGVNHDALCAFPVAFAARHRAQRSTAQSEQIGKRGNERHKGKAQADTCQRKRALAGDFADINAVYNIIQQVEQLRDEHRCGHRKYPAADAALRKINLLQTNTVLSKSEKSREKSKLLPALL